MIPSTLNCPQCGGAIAIGATQCQYCHVLLRTVACPSCMGMMFAGSKYCPLCGVPVEPIVEGEMTPRKCPRCQIALERVMVAGLPLDECIRCGGLWVDNLIFRQIVTDAEAQVEVSNLPFPPRWKVDTHVQYLNCPQCGTRMNRVNFAHQSGIIIGVCHSHGIWLDQDEIRRIIEFVRAGGVNRARQMERKRLRRVPHRSHFVPSDSPADSLLPQQSIGHPDSAGIAPHLVAGIAMLQNLLKR